MSSLGTPNVVRCCLSMIWSIRCSKKSKITDYYFSSKIGWWVIKNNTWPTASHPQTLSNQCIFLCYKLLSSHAINRKDIRRSTRIFYSINASSRVNDEKLQENLPYIRNYYLVLHHFEAFPTWHHLQQSWEKLQCWNIQGWSKFNLCLNHLLWDTKKGLTFWEGEL